METKEKEIILKAKRSFLYKLLKTSEGAIVLGGLTIGIILGWFSTMPAVILMAAYGIINAIGLANEPLYIARDKYFKKEE